MREAAKGEDARRRPWIAAVVLAGLAGGVAGAWAERVASGEPRPSEAPAGPADDGALVRELHALVAELAAQRQAADRGASPEASRPMESSAAPAPAALAPSTDVQGSIVALSNALQAFTQRLAAPSAPSIDVPPPDPARRKRIEALADPNQSKALSETLLWPVQKLVDTFGAPDSISMGVGGEQWVYRFENGSYVQFTLHDGHVISMYSPR